MTLELDVPVSRLKQEVVCLNYELLIGFNSKQHFFSRQFIHDVHIPACFAWEEATVESTTRKNKIGPR